MFVKLCVYVRACVRACVRARARACVCVCVCLSVCLSDCMCLYKTGNIELVRTNGYCTKCKGILLGSGLGLRVRV